MIRRSFRFGLLLGLLGAVAFALTKLLGGRSRGAPAIATRSSEPWPRLASDPAAGAAPIARAIPDPVAPGPTAPIVEEAVVEPVTELDAPPAGDPVHAVAPAKKKAAAKAWVEPNGGVCPTSHPVKAKLSSKIFHLPGMINYERTNPDRCYADAGKAEADGLRAAKR